jgi:cytidylate kinase
MKIAIDGPSGSGKSTISKALAKELSIGYLDTGAMYRAVTAWALNKQESLPSGWQAQLDHQPQLEISTDPNNFYIKIAQQDVTEEIRTQRITDSVSQVSADPKVRNWMVQLQRKIMNELRDIVMEGRDIATVVIPEADVKIFITADIDQRASRRSNEMDQSTQVTEQSLQVRDAKDSTREISPLRKAADAFEIDTTDLTIEESISRALEIVKAQAIHE